MATLRPKGDDCLVWAIRGANQLAHRYATRRQCTTTTMTAWQQTQNLETAHGLPALVYTHQDIANQEIDVFRRSWQLLAHAAQLAAPGDHIVDEIAGLPVLIVRSPDGALLGFHNVCRHRGGPLAIACGGGMKQLRCHYHGWSYDWNGALRSGPELDAMVDFDRAAVRLPAIEVAQWQGLVFASVAPEVPFAALTAGIDARIGAALSGVEFQKRISYTAQCNWKAYVDNYLEGYHVPHIHPALNRLLDYREYRTDCFEHYALQSSPLDAAESFYGLGEALYYQLWPNTMLNILPGRLQTNRIVPLAVNACRIDFDYYYTPELARDAAKIAADQALADDTQREDIDICERVQRAFASGSYDTGRVHPTREQGVHWFQERYRRAFA